MQGRIYKFFKEGVSRQEFFGGGGGGQGPRKGNSVGIFILTIKKNMGGGVTPLIRHCKALGYAYIRQGSSACEGCAKTILLTNLRLPIIL